MNLGLLATRLTMLTKNADIEFLPEQDEDRTRIILQIRTPVFTIHAPFNEKQTEEIRATVEAALANWFHAINKMSDE